MWCVFFSFLSFIVIYNKSSKVAPRGGDSDPSPVCASSCLGTSSGDGSCLENSESAPMRQIWGGKLRHAGASRCRRSWERGPERGRRGGCETSAGTAASSPADQIRLGSELRGAPGGFGGSQLLVAKKSPKFGLGAKKLGLPVNQVLPNQKREKHLKYLFY